MVMPAQHRMNLGSANTNRQRSPNIWSDCKWSLIENGTRNGVTFFDDFTKTPVLVTPTITTQANYGGGWKAFGSSGGTIISGGGAEGGTLVMTETDDNEGVSIATIDLPFKIIRTYGKFWFEARWKTSTITDNDSGIFIGAYEQQTLSAILPIVAAGTLADANFVGFHRLEGDGDQLDAVYKANTVTQVSAADILTTAIGTSALVADTYIKTGMKYNPNDYSFRFYINNIEISTSYTIPTAAGTDFPNDVFMGLCVAMLCGSSNDSILTLDWIRAAQEYDIEPAA